MNIKYKIEFHTDWHCGSGLAAGADVDALVIKDKDGVPFIPGKTVKGLVREAVEEIRGCRNTSFDDGLIAKVFGYFDKDQEEMEKGSVFFSNAEIAKNERDAIVANDAARFMFRSLASTAIGKDGIAKEHSLRKIQVVVPCALYGEIKNIPNGMVDEIAQALSFIKRLGQNRNRGLGRCTITEIERKEDVK